ncbi:hypothetical protein CYMTET_6416 [Cymbomonas tetramitiformis]|uniref:TET-Associated Glycosyltransferase domain-containing protein n=1 Tax=Cymbomonas tetramitiformis TaxID=36881 RepID=A0AAE0GXN5_9CHLO|nr:hypothetical protein CYMTET_6416 [Cymbomonas tetramitiformis]
MDLWPSLLYLVLATLVLVSISVGLILWTSSGKVGQPPLRPPGHDTRRYADRDGCCSRWWRVFLELTGAIFQEILGASQDDATPFRTLGERWYQHAHKDAIQSNFGTRLALTSWSRALLSQEGNGSEVVVWEKELLGKQMPLERFKALGLLEEEENSSTCNKPDSAPGHQVAQLSVTEQSSRRRHLQRASQWPSCPESTTWSPSPAGLRQEAPTLLKPPRLGSEPAIQQVVSTPGGDVVTLYGTSEKLQRLKEFEHQLLGQQGVQPVGIPSIGRAELGLPSLLVEEDELVLIVVFVPQAEVALHCSKWPHHIVAGVADIKLDTSGARGPPTIRALRDVMMETFRAVGVDTYWQLDDSVLRFKRYDAHRGVAPVHEAFLAMQALVVASTGNGEDVALAGFEAVDLQSTLNSSKGANSMSFQKAMLIRSTSLRGVRYRRERTQDAADVAFAHDAVRAGCRVLKLTAYGYDEALPTSGLKGGLQATAQASLQRQEAVTKCEANAKEDLWLGKRRFADRAALREYCVVRMKAAGIKTPPTGEDTGDQEMKSSPIHPLSLKSKPEDATEGAEHLCAVKLQPTATLFKSLESSMAQTYQQPTTPALLKTVELMKAPPALSTKMEELMKAPPALSTKTE